jgi:peroxiredoxin
MSLGHGWTGCNTGHLHRLALEFRPETFNSLDAPVCDSETRRWDALRAELPADVHIVTISMDLPFAQGRWCASAGANHQELSAHKNEDFGRAYGASIKEWRLRDIATCP